MNSAGSKSSQQSVIARRQPKLLHVLFTTYIYACLFAAMIGLLIVGGPFLIFASVTFDRARRLPRRWTRFLFSGLLRHFCWLCGNPLRVEAGALDPIGNAPCVIVANHASSLDVLMLMSLPLGAGDGIVWAKGWPFRVPILGVLMKLSGHLLVEDFNLLPDAQAWLAMGTSLLVFPEASRSRTGCVNRFHEGAFLLAARTGRPIVPVAIRGSFGCFPPGQPWIFGGRMSVSVLGVLTPDASGAKAHVDLRRRAHDMISSALVETSENVSSTSAAA